MSIDILSIKDFNNKIKSYIPIHQVSSLPRIGDVEGQDFECGCGSSHILNYEKHYLVADGGMFKAVFLSPDCGFLNALKLKNLTPGKKHHVGQGLYLALSQKGRGKWSYRFTYNQKAHA